jgi:hypothetical protein
LVILNGSLACQPRYVNNGDGTLTDNKTGLMWELATGTVGAPPTTDVKDVNKTYTWSSSGTTADGTLYTVFLATLNSDVLDSYVNGNVSSGISTCFANHCDWRIPLLAELQSILLAPYPCGTSPCIDPAFGPTQAGLYRSSSSVISDARNGWLVGFDDASVGTSFKTFGGFARAVRSAR